MHARSIPSPRHRSQILLSTGLIVGALVLLCLFLTSITLGVVDITIADLYQALTAFEGTTEQLIITTVRVPRSITAVIVGAAVAVAGAIMQGLTRNPLADPGILGINAGAALAVVASVFIYGATSLSVYALFALIGAGIAAITVYGLGSLGRGGLTPLNLTMAGAAITALVSSLTTAILITSQQTLEEIRFWLAGSLAGREMDLVLQVLPFLGIGLLIALCMGRQITALSLGETVAQGLGQSTLGVKLSAAVSVVLLAGGSVAIAGPIGFVGLITPHLVRFGVGADYRWILPYSALGGAMLLLVADMIARSILPPIELPVGLVMPLLGAPFFIYLTRSRVKR